MSHHLKTLEKAGLVSKERRGMSVHCTVETNSRCAMGVAIQLDDVDQIDNQSCRA